MNNQIQPRSRWLKRDATLLVFGIGGTLTGFVQLIPLIAPRLPLTFIQGLSVGVFALTAALLGVAFFGGRWAQARHVEKLRIRMIRRRRFLVRWEKRFRRSSIDTGFLLAFDQKNWNELRALDARRFRKARIHQLLLRTFGSIFDDQWLRFQRARNEYLIETDRKPLAIYETGGIAMLNKFNVEIGRQEGFGWWLSAKIKSSDILSEVHSAMLDSTKAVVRLQVALRDQDVFSQFLKDIDKEVRTDSGKNDDLGVNLLANILEEFASDEFRRKLLERE